MLGEDHRRRQQGLEPDWGKRAATLILIGVSLGFFFSFAYVFLLHGF